MDTNDELLALQLGEAGLKALLYHAQPERGASCGSMGTDMALILNGLADFAKDGRLDLTPKGQRMVDAIMSEAVA